MNEEITSIKLNLNFAKSVFQTKKKKNLATLMPQHPILIPNTPRIVSLAGQGRIPQHTYCSFVKKVCILFVKSISRCNLNQQLSTKTMHGMLILQPAWFTLIYGFACVILVKSRCAYHPVSHMPSASWYHRTDFENPDFDQKFYLGFDF